MLSSMSPRKSSIESEAGGWVWSLEIGEEVTEGMGQQPTREE